MATGLLHRVQNLWPFSMFKFDDLRASDKLVGKLPIPEDTKRFVFAFRDPDSQSLIYILCVQNLSERSAKDAECLIRVIKPDAVVAQVGHLTINEIQSEEAESWIENGESFPTSSFQVLKRCFLYKIDKDKYENMAGTLVLREIFGIGFQGHLLAAKRVAKEVGSSFFLLESPFMKTIGDKKCSAEADSVNKIQSMGFEPSSLISQKVASSVPQISMAITVSNDFRSQMVKSLASYLVDTNPASEVSSGRIQPLEDYEAPQFAESIYPLLVDLHKIFPDINSIGKALAQAQKVLHDISMGEIVDALHLSELYVFRIAIESLRVALTNSGRRPMNKLADPDSAKSGFSDLPVEEKSHALLAQALRSQSRKFRSIVAIVDSSCLAGLRKHFNTSVPPEVKDIVESLVTDYADDGDLSTNDTKRLLTGKPVLAVGAGATAILGVSSLSKAIPASNFMKLVAVKVPASLKLMMVQTQKAVVVSFGKTFGPGMAASGAKTTSSLKALSSAMKIRPVVHSVIASAEKTSLSAMKTAFYEIMRKRQVVRSVGFLPWATFGCSIAACSSLLVYGDGIECAAESFPAAPSIACLGRGIQSLHQASQLVRQTESFKSIEVVMNRIKKIRAE